MGNVRQVVYLSRATPQIGDGEARELGRLSALNNARQSITGLLLFDGQRFIQALEGPDRAVGDTLARIQADRRHTIMQIASDRLIGERQFGSWSMECRRTPAGACSLAFLEAIKRNLAGVDDPALQAMFIGFAVMGRE